MIQSNPFKWFKTSPELIRLAVMLYVRFPPFCDIRCCLAKGINGLDVAVRRKVPERPL